MEPLVSWALVACKASREILARLVRWVFKAFLVFQDPSAPWASKVLSVPRVSLALLVFVASKVSLVLLACVESRDPRETLVSKAPRETREMSASEDRMVRQA